ncbi:hypothetical protein [Streptosporangium sp. NPDC003464]
MVSSRVPGTTRWAVCGSRWPGGKASVYSVTAVAPCGRMRSRIISWTSKPVSGSLLTRPGRHPRGCSMAGPGTPAMWKWWTMSARCTWGRCASSTTCMKTERICRCASSRTSVLRRRWSRWAMLSGAASTWASTRSSPSGLAHDRSGRVGRGTWCPVQRPRGLGGPSRPTSDPAGTSSTCSRARSARIDSARSGCVRPDCQ